MKNVYEYRNFILRNLEYNSQSLFFYREQKYC